MVKSSRAPSPPAADAPCPHHGAEACCTECPGHRFTDGEAFPHPREANGRVALRRCPTCKRLVDRDNFVRDIERAIFACRRCARSVLVAREGEASTAVRALDAELGRRKARSVAIARVRAAGELARTVARRPTSRPRR
jgi:hydrogenase maturation factor HypF (carbamoyltransferase family)